MDVFENCVYSDAVVDRNKESHDALELAYLKSGQCKGVISDRIYDLNPGTLVILGKNEKHEFLVKSRKYERYYIIFSLSEIQKSISDPGLLRPFFNSDSHCIDMGEYAKDVEALFEKMVREYNRPREFSDEILLAYLKCILIYLRRILPNNHELQNNSLKTQLYNLKLHIEQNFSDPISIRKITENSHFDYVYLCKEYKKNMGISPYEYLMLCRINEAKRLLLKETFVSVDSLVGRCGFLNTSSFIRAFKKQVGLTPLQYRKKH